jgi:hypothetical protein
MDARSVLPRRRRSRTRGWAWLAAIALAAITLLPGTIVEEASASSAVPSPTADGDLQADATPTPEATPTPTPEATPTPMPEATPTPTPEATPTPTPEATPTPTPTPMTTGVIDVFKLIDRDGNPDTDQDRDSPPVWEFQAIFEDGVDILAADPETNFEEAAHWSFNFAGAPTQVVIVEVPQQGFRFQTGWCVTAGPDGGSEVPISVVPGVIFLDVVRTDLDFGLYACTFVNEPGDAGATAVPTVTLPPTSAATRGTSPAADDVRLALVAILGVLAGALLLTWRGSFGRRGARRD